MKTILTFIFVFCVIVIVHELGHFLFAKWSGILVREFSIGMGPKLFAHQGKDGTTYTIRMLPIGGYVRMAGLGEEEVEINPGQPLSLELDENQIVKRINTSSKVQLANSIPIEVTAFDLEKDLFIKGNIYGDERKEVTYQVDHDATIIESDGTEVRIAPLDVQFQSAKLYKRMLTNFAGPMFNFLLTFVIFIVILFAQGGNRTADPSSTIGSLVPDSVAEKAGILPGDRVLEVNGQEIATFEALTKKIQSSADQELKLLVQRGDKTETITLTPETQKTDDGKTQVVLGIYSSYKLEKLSFSGKLKAAVSQTITSAMAIFVALKGLLTGFSLNKLGGPVMIFQVSSQVAQQGFMVVLGFMATLSVNLGIMNLLPIPALDGGKLLLNLVEGVRRKPLSPESEGKITIFGFAFMMILMVLVTWNDIMRFFFR
ncbi:RIP metalloprotease RseP [Vagococcus salmoninarum]|uniref:RIP metalloprotease RseP n=1 Tax=Vagococcus salmoninarum TaxID=2739 RepID=UPI001880D24A|nr:RIP metalloprotease RseP [Vagococcus salmoninarum]MBE9389240.1 RIP metalloprotease RseP [Vagococcus salmoninarum]